MSLNRKWDDGIDTSYDEVVITPKPVKDRDEGINTSKPVNENKANNLIKLLAFSALLLTTLILINGKQSKRKNLRYKYK